MKFAITWIVGTLALLGPIPSYSHASEDHGIVVEAVPGETGVPAKSPQRGYVAKDIYSECLEKPMSPSEFTACTRRVDNARTH